MPVSSLVAVGLAGVFGCIAALHVRWAFGAGGGGAATLPTRTDGTFLFTPSRAGTLAVAAALTIAGLLVLGRSGVMVRVAPDFVYGIGTWALGAVLLLRTVGDFRYVGLFKRERRTPFAQSDTRIYTPLCAALAAGVFYVATT